MALQMNEKIVTTNELVRTVICSVLEDVDIHFDEYASEFVSNYSDYNKNELEKIEEWKQKIFKKLNAVLKKDGLI